MAGAETSQERNPLGTSAGDAARPQETGISVRDAFIAASLAHPISE